MNATFTEHSESPKFRAKVYVYLMISEKKMSYV